jgi:hypothetical protein
MRDKSPEGTCLADGTEAEASRREGAPEGEGG